MRREYKSSEMYPTDYCSIRDDDNVSNALITIDINYYVDKLYETNCLALKNNLQLKQSIYFPCIFINEDNEEVEPSYHNVNLHEIHIDFSKQFNVGPYFYLTTASKHTSEDQAEFILYFPDVMKNGITDIKDEKRFNRFAQMAFIAFEYESLFIDIVEHPLFDIDYKDDETGLTTTQALERLKGSNNELFEMITNHLLDREEMRSRSVADNEESYISQSM